MKFVEGKTVYSVSEINSIARKTLEQIQFWVEGELSSFKGINERYRYLYFDLKDPISGYKLPCIMEPDKYLDLNQKYEEGMKVLALGTLTLWEKDAKMQMHVQKMQEFGQGNLLAKLEKLKLKLEQKGYFAQEFKKNLSSYPANIAVITSKNSDAWFDFKKHTTHIYPSINITLYDVLVQGKNSTKQIIKAIINSDNKYFDLICLIRGGGSQENLSSFNDEKLAEIIFKIKTPIIVGVGHEKDITIASLVSDITASTPTDAAKIVTSDYINLKENMLGLKSRLKSAYINQLQDKSQHLDFLIQKLISNKYKYTSLPRALDSYRNSLISFSSKLIIEKQYVLQINSEELTKNMKNIILFNKQKLANIEQKLNLVSPDKILSRGYSITTNSKGLIIKDINSVRVGEKINIKLTKGKLSSRVLEKIK